MGIFIGGLVTSLALALIAIGFGLTFGISGIANFAHGAFYILAGYITWSFLKKAGLPFPLSIILSLLITSLCGILMYKFILRRIRGLTISEIIATFALGIGIMYLFSALGFVGPTYYLPRFIEGTVNIAGVEVSCQRLVIIGVGIALLIFLTLFSRYTKLGLAFRAIAQNERMSLALGINTDQIAMLSVAFGCMFAALAAAIILPLGAITTEAGFEVLIYAVAISILGGLGSIPGLFFGCFLLGYAQTLVESYVAPHWTMIATLAIIYLVLIFRPSGILGKAREIEERV